LAPEFIIKKAGTSILAIKQCGNRNGRPLRLCRDQAQWQTKGGGQESSVIGSLSIKEKLITIAGFRGNLYDRNDVRVADYTEKRATFMGTP